MAATRTHADTRTDKMGYRKLDSPRTRMCPTRSSMLHPRAPPPDPRLKTGARVRHFRGCNNQTKKTRPRADASGGESLWLCQSSCLIKAPGNFYLVFPALGRPTGTNSPSKLDLSAVTENVRGTVDHAGWPKSCVNQGKQSSCARPGHRLGHHLCGARA